MSEIIKKPEDNLQRVECKTPIDGEPGGGSNGKATPKIQEDSRGAIRRAFIDFGPFGAVDFDDL